MNIEGFEQSFFPIFWTLMGALWGSFANVAILRVPKGESVVKPRSHCPKCKTPVRAFDNIPIVSFFILGGKCRQCRERISWRYPLVEFLSAILFLSLYLKFKGTFFFYELLILGWGMLVISFIDLDHRIIPDKFSLPGIVIGLVGAAINPERSLTDALLGILAGGGFLWIVGYLYLLLRKQEGMGGGDIKLLAWIGAVLGWKSIPFIILGSSIGGSFIGGTIGFFKKTGLKTAIPFGPFIVLAALTYIFFGQQISQAYVQLFFPWLTNEASQFFDISTINPA